MVGYNRSAAATIRTTCQEAPRKHFATAHGKPGRIKAYLGEGTTYPTIDMILTQLHVTTTIMILLTVLQVCMSHVTCHIYHVLRIMYWLVSMMHDTAAVMLRRSGARSGGSGVAAGSATMNYEPINTYGSYVPDTRNLGHMNQKQHLVPGTCAPLLLLLLLLCC